MQQEGKPAGAPVAVVDAAEGVKLDPALTQPASLVHVPHELPNRPAIVFDDARVEILKTTIMPKSSDAELDFFMIVCRRTGLDPFARQIHAVKRGSYQGKGRDRKWVDKWVYQVAIDGFRLIAERTGKYRGQTVPMFCGDDGVWKEVWLSREAPRACKVGVLRSDFDQPLYAIALWDEYVQLVDRYEDGPDGQAQSVGKKPNSMWASKPCIMLAKVAEALALRKAFPQELSGIYSDDEMGKADEEEAAERRRNAQTNASPRASVANDARVQWSGSGAVFPYGPLKDIYLNARYHDGATRTKKGRAGAPAEVIQCGGEYVVSMNRLNEALTWATSKLTKHRHAEEAGDATSKDFLDERDIERLIAISEDVRAELARREDETSVPSHGSEGSQSQPSTPNSTPRNGVTSAAGTVAAEPKTSSTTDDRPRTADGQDVTDDLPF